MLIFLSEDLHFLWLVQCLFLIYKCVADYSTGIAFPTQTHSWKLFDACQTAVWGASFAISTYDHQLRYLDFDYKLPNIWDKTTEHFDIANKCTLYIPGSTC